MKKIFLIFFFLLFIYYFRKYKTLKDFFDFDLIDIESKEDLLDKANLFMDEAGKIHEK